MSPNSVSPSRARTPTVSRGRGRSSRSRGSSSRPPASSGRDNQERPSTPEPSTKSSHLDVEDPAPESDSLSLPSPKKRKLSKASDTSNVVVKREDPEVDLDQLTLASPMGSPAIRRSSRNPVPTDKIMKAVNAVSFGLALSRVNAAASASDEEGTDISWAPSPPPRPRPRPQPRPRTLASPQKEPSPAPTLRALSTDIEMPTLEEVIAETRRVVESNPRSRIAGRRVARSPSLNLIDDIAEEEGCDAPDDGGVEEVEQSYDIVDQDEYDTNDPFINDRTLSDEEEQSVQVEVEELFDDSGAVSSTAHVVEDEGDDASEADVLKGNNQAGLGIPTGGRWKSVKSASAASHSDFDSHTIVDDNDNTAEYLEDHPPISSATSSVRKSTKKDVLSGATGQKQLPFAAVPKTKNPLVAKSSPRSGKSTSGQAVSTLKPPEVVAGAASVSAEASALNSLLDGDDDSDTGDVEESPYKTQGRTIVETSSASALVEPALDVSLQHPALQPMYERLPAKARVRRASMINFKEDDSNPPSALPVDVEYAFSSLKLKKPSRIRLMRALEFDSYNRVLNITRNGNIPVILSRYDPIHISYAGRQVPAVWVTTGFVWTSNLQGLPEPGNSAVTKNIYLRQLCQEWELIQGALGALIKCPTYHVRLIQENGAMSFGSKKRPDTSNGTASRRITDSSRGAGCALPPINPGAARSTTAPLPLVAMKKMVLYDEDIPVYDGRTSPRNGASGFMFTDLDWKELETLPRFPLVDQELPEDALVTVGFTIISYDAIGNNMVYKGLNLNLLFIIVLDA
ncbi:hypothetical protein V5O48_015310 [Marasmius crinis-equi]|uniref:Uncharacterized protein n=1 Tax=Marasmius crinis-equi TaxID=585013 RepID=A0ABR3EUV3_9AGAR